MKTFIHWIALQVEWVKSFWSEPSKSIEVKGSNKRLLSTFTVITFMVPYWKVSLASKKLEDIPLYWALLIASIIGLNIADYLVKGYINRSVNNTPEKKDAN